MHKAKAKIAVQMKRQGFKLWAISQHVRETQHEVAKVLLAEGWRIHTLSHPNEQRKR